MAAEIPLWGTFSVADHLRQRPFVADVLLYDRLIVPIPDGETERERWRGINRKPDLQADLLSIIGEDLSLPVRWTLARHNEWAERVGRPAEPDALVRDEVAQAVRFDVMNVEQLRRNEAIRSGPSDPDDSGQLMTRIILTDVRGLAEDQALVRRISRVDEVEAVVAYGSYADFAKDRGDLADEEEGSQPVFTFQWQFVVPEDSRLTDKELLRRAVELAHKDEVADWRAAVQRWRRNSVLKGQSDEEGLCEMEEMIRKYSEAARRLRIATAVRTGVAVVAAVGGAAAVIFPPAGVTALFGLASLKRSKPVPKQFEAAAIFHEARRRFR